MDFIYVGIVVAFFVLTWGVMKMCDALMEDKSGGHS